MASVGQCQIAVASLRGDQHQWLPLTPPLGPYLGWHSHILWYPQGQAHPVSSGGRGRDSGAGRVWHERGWQRAGRSLPDGPGPSLLPTVCIQEGRALLETPQPKWEQATERDSDSRLHPAAESPPQTHPGTPGAMATPPHTEQRSLLNTFWV